MIIIYRCYGGTHSSVMAASIHLELLPGDRKPAGKELLALPYFDRIQPCFNIRGKRGKWAGFF